MIKISNFREMGAMNDIENIRISDSSGLLWVYNGRTETLHHVPTGKTFKSKAQAEAYDELFTRVKKLRREAKGD